MRMSERHNLKKRGFAMLSILGLALSAAGTASADTAADKFGRGLAAMTTGFLELPGNIVVESRRSGAAVGMTYGFAKGLGGIVVRELVGVYEFVTAPFPVPAGYEPILSPEYPWGYFDESREYARTSNP
jgi:putative exosortase-associated protein (TIGR04073 family)